MCAALSGKVSIITGASSGLGLATAILFARRGALVTLGGRDEGRLKEALTSCVQASGGHEDRFLIVPGDVSNAKVREEMVAKTVHKFGHLDVLVPCAGILLPQSSVGNATEEAFDQTMDINVKSVFFLIQQALPHLQQSRGNIVSVSSVLGNLPSGGAALYCMSKASIDHMTRCLALDLGPKGIRVNSVKPSLVRTRMKRHTTGAGDLDEVYDKVIQAENANQPMGSVGTPEDIAEAISFLASDSAKFITGECLDVGGGRSLTGSRIPPAPPSATSSAKQ